MKNRKMSMAAAKLEDQRRSQQYFAVYQPWELHGKPSPRQLAKDARKRYAKRQRLTERGRNIAVAIVAVLAITAVIAASRYFNAVEVALR